MDYDSFHSAVGTVLILAAVLLCWTASVVLGGNGVGTETGRSDERSCRGQAENAVLSET